MGGSPSDRKIIIYCWSAPEILPTVQILGNGDAHLSLGYNHASQNDVDLILQYSSTLAEGSWTDMQISGTNPDGAVQLGSLADRLQPVEVTIPAPIAPENKLFWRLMFTQN